jgi:ribosomal protein L11 methyltransferase
MAFGTGQHPTTRMCLQALQELLRPGDEVLDLGTGSGVLALAAAALGARSVLAVDTEEQAVAAARGNVALNQAQGRVEVLAGSIDAAGDGRKFDLVLANINAATVSSLAAQITRALKPAGILVAGGIIAEREAGCVAALAAAGRRVNRRLQDGDWRTLIARKA